MLVVGGGIAGIQASLDLAGAGFPVALVEKSPLVGGTMARLERIFPDRECSVCLLSPKLVELGRHPGIRVITTAQVRGLAGEAGNFTAAVVREPPYVDAARCNDCGLCAANCPAWYPGFSPHPVFHPTRSHDRAGAPVFHPTGSHDRAGAPVFHPTGSHDPAGAPVFHPTGSHDPAGAPGWTHPFTPNRLGGGLGTPPPGGYPGLGSGRRAIYATGGLPGSYRIDPERCLHLGAGSRGSCGICARICPTGAIDFARREEDAGVLEVGAVILATGFEQFDPALLPRYQWGKSPGVLTSLEFEQLAAGVPEGPLYRPGDGRRVDRIAWIQCLGSRNERIGGGYCSSVCCLNTAKEATLVRERWPEVRCVVFYTDRRASGPHAERGFAAAVEAGVRYERSQVGEVTATPAGDWQLRYARPGGLVVEESFDLVVLALGWRPRRDTMYLASTLGLPLNRWGFCAGGEPGAGGRPGIYVAGGCRAPQDIAGSVTDGSAAAAQAAVFLSAVRPAVIAPPVPERDGGGGVRVGVFVCRCGSNIGGVVDVPAVAREAAGLAGVVCARECRYACSEEGQALIDQAVDEHGITRVVVAACTPRYQGRLFADGLARAGLNPGFLEMANIREQCSWVHRTERRQATAKATALVRRAVARARLAEPLPVVTVAVRHSALVVGGGPAGLAAALDLADQGIAVHLVEKADRLGGRALVPGAWPGEDGVRAYVHGLADRVAAHPAVTVYLGAALESVRGRAGEFTATVHLAGGRRREVEYGAAVIAAGGREASLSTYLYGRHRRVWTVTETARVLEVGAAPVGHAATVVMVLCAGSRDDKVPYCSMVCCYQAVSVALLLAGRGARVFVLYRDLRTDSFREETYRKARRAGVVFAPYGPKDAPRVEERGDGLRVSVPEPYLDVLLQLDADLLVLAPPVLPPAGAADLARVFKVPLDEDGFLAAVHAKLAPVDLPADGLYVAGTAHGPRFAAQAVIEGRAAAMRAMKVLAGDTWQVVQAAAHVRADLCSGCGVCLPLCPYEAIRYDAGKAAVEATLCKGCGVCAAACPSRALVVPGCRDREVLAEIAALCD